MDQQTELYSGLPIEETMRRRGVMALLLRVSRRIWDENRSPFQMRYAASQIPLDCWHGVWMDRWGSPKSL